MKVTVKTEGIDISMPVPMAMAEVAIKAVPETVFKKIRKEVPPPFDSLVCKEAVLLMFRECRDIFKENKGLEIVHVEGCDGTLVSIVL